jgi:hypothetical protein
MMPDKVSDKNKARAFRELWPFSLAVDGFRGVTDEPAFQNSRLETSPGNIGCLVKNPNARRAAVE